MKRVELRKTKKGEYIKREKGAKKVYRRGEYDRSLKKIACSDEDDIYRSIYLKPDTYVWIDFCY
ncbi:MAG: hypothetical protein ACPG62_10735 [Cycloclasticus sp.]